MCKSFKCQIAIEMQLKLERGCSMFCFLSEYEKKDGGRDVEENHNFYTFNCRQLTGNALQVLIILYPKHVRRCN